MKKTSFAFSAFLAVMAVGATSATSAEDYPSRLVTMIVPFPAGSGPDVYARMIGGKLAPRLGHPVVIENRAGAGGIIGGRAVAAAAPDGYTLLFGSTSSLMIAPVIAKDTPYEATKAFTPVIQVARGPFILSVRSSLPVHSLAELVAYAKANPGKLNYGSSGIGSLHHLATEMLKHAAGIDMTHIPYPGGAQSWTALQSEVVDVLFDSMPGPITSLQTNKARPIAVTGDKRLESSADLPHLGDIPTFAEQGMKDVEVIFWFGIVAPAGTPAPIVARLNRDLRASIEDPEVKAKIEQQSVEVAAGSAEEFGALMTKDAVRWRNVVEATGLKQK